jgi:hypothetical protein
MNGKIPAPRMVRRDICLFLPGDSAPYCFVHEERLLCMFRSLSCEMRVFVLKKLEEMLIIDEEKWGKLPLAPL